jgi:hypothetical protein
MGCQYTAVLFTKRCERAGVEISIGSVGDCYDNAVCETFHASIKKERIYRQAWPTRAEARAAVFEYIEGWYNPRRRHSTLGYLSPAEYERQHAEQLQAALESTPSSNGSLVGITPTTPRRSSSVGLAPMVNGQPQPKTALGSATASAQAATTCSRPERLTAGLSAG